MTKELSHADFLRSILRRFNSVHYARIQAIADELDAHDATTIVLKGLLQSTEQENQRLRHDLERSMTNHVADLNSRTAEPLSVGASVTYAPRHASQLPRDGWTVDRLPPEPTYVIRHPEGSVIAVSAGEIQAAQKSTAEVCPHCGPDGPLGNL